MEMIGEGEDCVEERGEKVEGKKGEVACEKGDGEVDHGEVRSESPWLGSSRSWDTTTLALSPSVTPPACSWCCCCCCW